jgi:hypothetical protein
MPRTFKQVTITIPTKEHKEALKLLPHGEARTFSALIRLALKNLQQKHEPR